MLEQRSLTRKIVLVWLMWKSFNRPREMWKCEKRRGLGDPPGDPGQGLSRLVSPSQELSSCGHQRTNFLSQHNSGRHQKFVKTRGFPGLLLAISQEFVDLAAAITNLSRVMLHYHVQHSQAFQINCQKRSGKKSSLFLIFFSSSSKTNQNPPTNIGILVSVPLLPSPHKFVCLWLNPRNRDGDKATIVGVTIDNGNREHTGHNSK